MVLYGTFTNVTFTDATFSDVTFTDVNNPTEAHFTDPFFVLAPNGNLAGVHYSPKKDACDIIRNGWTSDSLQGYKHT